MLTLSATIGFEKGKVPLERELQIDYVQLPKSLFACQSTDSSFSLRGGHVTLLLMGKWHDVKLCSEKLHDRFLLTSVVHPLIH